MNDVHNEAIGLKRQALINLLTTLLSNNSYRSSIADKVNVIHEINGRNRLFSFLQKMDRHALHVH